MSIQKTFTKVKCSKCEFIEECKDTNYIECYLNHLESLVEQMLEALKKSHRDHSSCIDCDLYNLKLEDEIFNLIQKVEGKDKEEEW